MTESELRALEYDALTARVDAIVSRSWPYLTNLVESSAEELPTRGVTGAAEHLLDELHEINDLSHKGMWVLARNLHRNGMPYHVIAAKLGVSPMTARRRIAEHAPEEGYPIQD